ncbi:hypothetical protein BpHYR1_034677, partial [Brachionus plicatilis]
MLCKTRQIFKLNPNNVKVEQIENQRYKKKKKTFKLKQIASSDQRNGLSIVQQDLKNQLMKEIESYGTGNASEILRNSESWQVNSGDRIKIQVDADNNVYKILFYYNNELIGTYSEEDVSSKITPYIEVNKGGISNFFFDISRLKPKSPLASTFKFQPGMLIEIEKEIDQAELATYDDIIKSYITAARVEKIDETFGLIEYKILGQNVLESIEPTSNRVHPCGFWNYVHQEIHLKKEKADDAHDYSDLICFRVFDSMLDKH